jgi:transposase
MYIGIDLHKETCYATTLDKEGEIVDRREFKNEREEWEKFVDEMPRDSKVALEASSYWYPVCDLLENRGIEMVLSHPSKTRIIAEAKIIKNEIGEIERFPSYKELCSFAGLVPWVHQSGNTRWEGHITKEGNALLRWILIQAVHQVVRYPGELRKFYIELKKKKGAKIAVVATARKLLSMCYQKIGDEFFIGGALQNPKVFKYTELKIIYEHYNDKKNANRRSR